MASQTKMVLEENRNLMSQHKAQQLIIAGLQRQLHSRGESVWDVCGDGPSLDPPSVAELERDLAQTVEAKRSMETQLRQMTDSHSHLLHRISALLGVSVSSESDHLARYSTSQSISHSLVIPAACWRDMSVDRAENWPPFRAKLQ